MAGRMTAPTTEGRPEHSVPSVGVAQEALVTDVTGMLG
jgi:hypothetical protein